VTYNSQPPLRSEFKSASFSSSCRINYVFKAKMSPFTKWVADKGPKVQRNCNKPRNMATGKMNFPLGSTSSYLSHTALWEPHSALLGGALKRGQTQLYPVGGVHTEWLWEHKRSHVLPRDLEPFTVGPALWIACQGGWPTSEGFAWNCESGPGTTWQWPNEASCEVPLGPELPGQLRVTTGLQPLLTVWGPSILTHSVVSVF
jgi:hypothetical protein